MHGSEESDRPNVGRQRLIFKMCAVLLFLLFVVRPLVHEVRYEVWKARERTVLGRLQLLNLGAVAASTKDREAPRSVRYSYRVQGQEYLGDRLFDHPPFLFRPRGALEELSRTVLDSQVVVHYESSDPAVAHLVHTFRPRYYLLVGVALFGGLFLPMCLSALRALGKP